MPILVLSRAKPLSIAEATALPHGCVALDGSGGIVARAQVELPLAELLAYAVAMGRAAPDAAFSLEVPAAPAPTDEVITEADPWKLVDAGKWADAERVFAAGNGLDQLGRERCRALLMDRDPTNAAFGCRVARVTNWKSIVVNIRPLLRHDHPAVRRDAVEAIGALAGPSMAQAVKPLLDDPDAEVRGVAKAAFARLGG